VTHLVSGARISSERRAGASTSFIDPLLMKSVDVLRGPSTTQHGSGALGGVLRSSPRSFDGWSMDLGYASSGDGAHQLVGIGGEGWSLGIAHRSAGDAETATGDPLNSAYDQYSAIARGAWQGSRLSYDLLFVPSYGQDIGKSNTDFPDRITTYPRERHGLLRFAVASDRDWKGQIFFHAQDLVTNVYEPGVAWSSVDNESIDFGLRWDGTHRVSDTFGFVYGVESYNRRGVTAEESRQDFGLGATGQVERTLTLDDGRQDELGVYAVLEIEGLGARWEAGTRYSWIQQENAGGAAEEHDAWSGNVGVAWPFAKRWELRGAASSGVRFPGLTELFFSGTTGRGETVGNPALESERALNTEATLRWLGRGLFVGGTLFHNRIDDYIERIELKGNQRSFVNLTSGTIRGVEVEGAFHPAESWNLFWSGASLRGRSSGGEPLSDVPPVSLALGGGCRVGRWSIESSWTWRDAKSDPGNDEKPIPSAHLWDVAVMRSIAASWTLAVAATNLLDEEYFRSADRKAPFARGRSFTLGVSFRP